MFFIATVVVHTLVVFGFVFQTFADSLAPWGSGLRPQRSASSLRAFFQESEGKASHAPEDVAFEIIRNDGAGHCGFYAFAQGLKDLYDQGFRIDDKKYSQWKKIINTQKPSLVEHTGTQDDFAKWIKKQNYKDVADALMEPLRHLWFACDLQRDETEWSLEMRDSNAMMGFEELKELANFFNISVAILRRGNTWMFVPRFSQAKVSRDLVMTLANEWNAHYEYYKPGVDMGQLKIFLETVQEAKENEGLVDHNELALAMRLSEESDRQEQEARKSASINLDDVLNGLSPEWTSCVSEIWRVMDIQKKRGCKDFLLALTRAIVLSQRPCDEADSAFLWQCMQDFNVENIRSRSFPMESIEAAIQSLHTITVVADNEPQKLTKLEKDLGKNLLKYWSLRRDKEEAVKSLQESYEREQRKMKEFQEKSTTTIADLEKKDKKLKADLASEIALLETALQKKNLKQIETHGNVTDDLSKEISDLEEEKKALENKAAAYLAYCQGRWTALQTSLQELEETPDIRLYAVKCYDEEQCQYVFVQFGVQAVMDRQDMKKNIRAALKRYIKWEGTDTEFDTLVKTFLEQGSPKIIVLDVNNEMLAHIQTSVAA